MRVITTAFLHEMTKKHPPAASWIAGFIETASAAQWKSIVEVRGQYPHADAVTVASKRTVIIFNVAGNKYRLIAAIHFSTQIIFTLRFLTHAEYSKEHWKKEL